MRKCFFFMLCLCASCVMAQDKTTDYQTFRRQMLDNYQGFRKKVLDDYASFIDAVWKDYEAFTGKEYYPYKKPKAMPEASPVDNTPSTIVPTPDVAEPTVPAKEEVPEPVKPDIGSVVPPAPLQKCVSFNFYSLKARVPSVDLPSLNGIDGHAVSVLWNHLCENDIYKKVSPTLNQYRMACNLNDWLTFQFVREYAAALYPGDDNSSVVLTHYLLANMGFDIRMGRGRDDRLMLLVPFRQMAYSRPYLDINGVKYFIFMYDGGKDVSKTISKLATYSLPDDADLGKAFNLVVDKLQLPADGGKQYERTDGVITLRGTVPNMPVDVASRIVQTDIPVYAKSCLSATFHNDLLGQVKTQIEGLSEVEAVSRLMHFLQFAFKYATDGDQFGYEKPFFIEENFYYPSNDCEDRAVLLSFLVRNLLGLDVHLLHFPEHEATAICFSDQSLNGDGYIYNGKKYLICDPTYIGAGIGRCMPQYENVKPEIEN
jgi:hypothetical protein